MSSRTERNILRAAVALACVAVLYRVAPIVATQTAVLMYGNNAGASKAITVDPSGNLNVKCLSGCTGGGGTPGGATTNVQYNNAGAFAGSGNFTFSTGTSTNVLIKGGSAQSNTIRTFEVQTGGGLNMFSVDEPNSRINFGGAGQQGQAWYFGSGAVAVMMNGPTEAYATVRSVGKFAFSNGGDVSSGSVDTALSRVSAGLVKIEDGSGNVADGIGRVLTSQRNSIGAISTDGYLLSNTTTAGAGAQQWSPRVHWTGSGWKTAATAGPQPVDYLVELIPIQEATNPLAQLAFSFQTNGLGYTKMAAFAQQSGTCSLANGDCAVLNLRLGSGGGGSLGPLDGSDHINVTRNSNGVVVGFGSWNAGADLGQMGLALNGFGVNTVQYTTSTANQAGAFGTGDASGTNIAGGNTTLYAGRSTGTGAGGSIFLQTSPAAGSGSATANTLASVLTIDQAGHVNNPQNFGAPTCPTNCGTSPAIAGGDIAGIVTMGATGTPASGWVFQFAKAFAAAPSCEVTMALASMAIGKIPLTVVTTTTNFTVTTNGTAPSNSDKYAYHCFGIQ